MRIPADLFDMVQSQTEMQTPIALPMRPSPKEDFADNQDVIIMVDGSSSISEEDFSKMKQLCAALAIRYKGAKTQLGLVQFSGTAKEEQCLTTDRALFDNKISAMAQLRHGTDILAGLKLCAQAFSHSSMPGNMKQLWIFTDGQYTGDNPAPFARELQRKGIIITAVGIGWGITKSILESFATHNRVFWKENFDEAVEFISSGINPDLSSEYIHLQVFLNKPINKIGYDVPFTVEIRNDDYNRPIPAGSMVYVPQNQYFNACRIHVPEEIKPLHQGRTNFVLQSKNSNIRNKFHKWILKLPPLIDIHLCDRHGNRIPACEDAFELSIDRFTGDVVEWSSPDTTTPGANILMFGPQGAGKSSFVNSIFSALSDDVQDISVAGGGSSRITDCFLQYPTALTLHDSDAERTKINFFDCPGIEVGGDATYEGEEIEMILEGVMKQKEVIVNRKLLYSDLKRSGRLNRKKDAWNQRIHSIIFVIPQEYADDCGDDLIAPYVAMFEKLTITLQRKVVVAVSKFDKVNQENSKEVLQQIADSFNIPVDRVFPLINYSSGVANNEKSFDLDRKILHVLYAALKGASEFMMAEKLGHVRRLFDFDDEELENQIQDQLNISNASRSNAPSASTNLMEEIWTFTMDLLNEDCLTMDEFDALQTANEGRLRSVYASAMRAKSEEDKRYRFLRGVKAFKLI